MDSVQTTADCSDDKKLRHTVCPWAGVERGGKYTFGVTVELNEPAFWHSFLLKKCLFFDL